MEKKLLASMNELLSAYGELLEKVLGVRVRLPDQLQVVKDGIMVGGFGLHNDQSGLCCLCNDEAKVEGSNQQDGPEYMTVVTYVISSTKIRHTKVVWKNGHME